MRLGLIGAGRWGKRYIATIRGLPGVHLAHLGSANPESQRLVPPGCRVSADYRQVVATPGVDAIILATPPATHCELAVAAVARGIPVLVEKPMTLDADQAARLVEASQRERVLVMVDHTHLFSPAFRTLLDLGQRMGSLLSVEAQAGNRGPVRPDTSVLWDWGPHDVAMSMVLFHGSPAAVSATRLATEEMAESTGESLRMELGFGYGRCADIRVSNIEHTKVRRLTACYSEGILVYDDLAPDKLALQQGTGAGPRAVPVAATMPLTVVVSEFCERVRAGCIEDPSLQLGHDVVRVLWQCQSCLDRG